MKLREYAPNEILLTTDTIQNVSNQFSETIVNETNQSKYREITIALIVDICLNLIAIIPNISILPSWAKIIIGIIFIGLVIYLSMNGFRWYESCKKLKSVVNNSSLDSMLMERAKSKLRYTAIIRITYKENNEVYYLTGKDYFLPHCTMNECGTMFEQNENIIQCLYSDFKIQERDILEIKAVDEQVHYSIKPIHNNLQMNAFVFYDVLIKIQSKEKLIQNNNKRWWHTIAAMKKKPEAMSTNKDVINLLEELPAPKDSFVNVLGNIKIIWNITSKCHYNCSICATHDEELDAKDKLNVLNSICTAKKLIKNIDFAGGDPLHFDESVTIIQAAITQLGDDKISITTTGEGVAESVKNKFSNIVKHCEITIDAAHSNLDSQYTANDQTISRDENEYCSTNINQINLLLEHTDSLTINVPIINDDLSEDEINILIKKIVNIRDHNPNVDIDVTLLRLMPVGRLAHWMDKDKYKQYNPISVANKIKKELEKNSIVCKLHCSLRILPIFGKDECCTMLENKLGVDCAGNVFSCAWGGYVPCTEPITKNPFYLGNLTRVSLIDILEGRSKTNQYRNIMAEINAKSKRKYCSVVSYYNHKKQFENFDPLSSCLEV